MPTGIGGLGAGKEFTKRTDFLAEAVNLLFNPNGNLRKILLDNMFVWNFQNLMQNERRKCVGGIALISNTI